jgi:hypothetical protein
MQTSSTLNVATAANMQRKPRKLFVCMHNANA